MLPAGVDFFCGLQVCENLDRGAAEEGDERSTGSRQTGGPGPSGARRGYDSCGGRHASVLHPLPKLQCTRLLGADEQAEELLARPQLDWLDDRRRRQVHALLVVCGRGGGRQGGRQGERYRQVDGRGTWRGTCRLRICRSCRPCTATRPSTKPPAHPHTSRALPPTGMLWASGEADSHAGPCTPYPSLPPMWQPTKQKGRQRGAYPSCRPPFGRSLGA